MSLGRIQEELEAIEEAIGGLPEGDPVRAALILRKDRILFVAKSIYERPTEVRDCCRHRGKKHRGG